MSKFDKLLEKIKSLSKDARFYELKKILEYYGYTMSFPKGGSSHATFRKDGKTPITIPMKSPVKVIYVKMVQELIESEAKENEES